jgi:autophagy-related protein 18
LVATQEAILYVYNLDPNEGGDLTLYKQHRLSDLHDSTRGTTTTEPQSIEGGSAILASYAGIVKGNPVGQMSESEKLREIAAATESPPRGPFHFNDDQEYPPLTQNSD